ncbi:MAG: GNAT family N-acetyltransferase [Gemmatimonadota bacterium]
MLVTRTYLEMTDPADLRDDGVSAPPGARVVAVDGCTPELYRFLYGTVGRNYHWVDRLAWDDDTLRAHLARPDILIRMLWQDDEPAGYYELARHDDDSVEIAYFGLLPGWLGRGLGRFLLVHAVREAWSLGATRVWLHTCTLDDPAALPNYLRRGFQPCRTEQYEQHLDA